MAATNAFSRETDLTGVWSGAYWYGATGMPTPFTAHIIEFAGSLSGTTLEPATFGSPGLAELSADISGSAVRSMSGSPSSFIRPRAIIAIRSRDLWTTR